jgi:alkylhydroperoxidase family enzyme
MRVGMATGDEPELATFVEKLRKGRRGVVLKLYKVLMNTPALAETWFEHLNAVRWKTKLDGRLRELVIIRIAHVCRIAYVLKQHIPVLAEAEGVTLEECEALADWRDSGFFDARERAALAYADSMTRTIDVEDAVFDALPAHFDQQHIIELTVLVATYNMHVRVIQALKIEPEGS